MKPFFLALASLLAALSLPAQDEVFNTFKDRWVINTHSVETLPKRKLDLRITHRFGDAVGDAGGWTTFYGLENAVDVSIGAEYGFTKRLSGGGARSKGGGSLKQLVTGTLKCSLLRQQESGGAPVSLVLLGVSSMSTSEKSPDTSSLDHFEKFPHRLVHHAAVLAGRKFSDRLSLQLSGGVTHRNVVPAGEENNLLHAGLAFRLQLTKSLGFIGDLAVPLNGAQSPFTSLKPAGTSYHTPFGVGFEFETGGHVFQLNLTNATGIMPTDYIPYTQSNWSDGEFRIGFTISRLFNL